jgi:hypothetical protein
MIIWIVKILQLIVRYWILLYIFSLCLTWVTFVVYHMYYGSFIFLSWFVHYNTLNLMFYPTVAVLMYYVYDYIYN